MTLTPINSGWIEVICGPMFSGKTEELIRRLKRAIITKKKVLIFTLDGSGDGVSATVHIGHNHEMETLKTISSYKD